MGISTIFRKFFLGLIFKEKGLAIFISSTLFLESSQITRKGKKTKKECIEILVSFLNSKIKLSEKRVLQIKPVNFVKRFVVLTSNLTDLSKKLIFTASYIGHFRPYLSNLVHLVRNLVYFYLQILLFLI